MDTSIIVHSSNIVAGQEMSIKITEILIGAGILSGVWCKPFGWKDRNFLFSMGLI
jgi:hypothetical protein